MHSASRSKKQQHKKASRHKKKSSAQKGDALLDQVCKLSGLPHKDLKNELKEILDRKNINIHHLNISDLRCAAASYVREIMTSLLDKYHLRKSDSVH
jgi:hypothetical protein